MLLALSDPTPNGDKAKYTPSPAGIVPSVANATALSAGSVAKVRLTVT